MGDWLHCNVCICLPGQKSENLPYFFTSCGHVICRKCLQTAEPHVCRVCKERANLIEINRNLRPELQMYFRSPKELLEQYIKNLIAVLEFQGGHRSRLMKAHHEQQKKAMKFVMAFQAELKKKAETEKKIVVENDSLSREVEKLRQHCQKLENIIDSHKRNRTPGSYSRGSMESRGSIESSSRNTAQFPFVATSTPLSDCLITCGGASSSSAHTGSASRLAAVFGKGNNEPSPILPVNMLTTPDMLGIKKSKESFFLNQKNGIIKHQNHFGFSG